MKDIRIPDYLSGLFNNSRDAVCDTLSNPSLWSETLIKQTLNRMGSQAFNITDVQHIVENYLKVLVDTIKEGKNIS